LADGEIEGRPACGCGNGLGIVLGGGTQMEQWSGDTEKLPSGILGKPAKSHRAWRVGLGTQFEIDPLGRDFQKINNKVLNLRLKKQNYNG
jgi:hypothetical protein